MDTDDKVWFMFLLIVVPLLIILAFNIAWFNHIERLYEICGCP